MEIMKIKYNVVAVRRHYLGLHPAYSKVHLTSFLCGNMIGTCYLKNSMFVILIYLSAVNSDR